MTEPQLFKFKVVSGTLSYRGKRYIAKKQGSNVITTEERLDLKLVNKVKLLGVQRTALRREAERQKGVGRTRIPRAGGERQGADPGNRSLTGRDISDSPTRLSPEGNRGGLRALADDAAVVQVSSALVV